MTDKYLIEYENLIAAIRSDQGTIEASVLAEWLEGEWLHFYKEMTPRVTNISGYMIGTFEYVYDHYEYDPIERTDPAAIADNIESRIVYVHGRSSAAPGARKTSRQRGWVGPTEKYLGADTDKGHFIAHSFGGGLEINIFAQSRGINRGWSEQGKLYRQMERYCTNNPETYCFSRPIYSDLSSRPQSIEFGILKLSGELWVERFENR